MSGIGTRKLKIELDGVEQTAEVSKAVVTSAGGELDFLSFAGAAAGGRAYKLNIVAQQNAATGSLWREVWDNVGTKVPVTLMPYGNAAPSVAEPHYTMEAEISEPDGDLLGGEADLSTSARFTFEVTWDLTAKPTEVTV
jgi:hypothetical protein